MWSDIRTLAAWSDLKPFHFHTLSFRAESFQKNRQPDCFKEVYHGRKSLFSRDGLGFILSHFSSTRNPANFLGCLRRLPGPTWVDQGYWSDLCSWEREQLLEAFPQNSVSNFTPFYYREVSLPPRSCTYGSYLTCNAYVLLTKTSQWE